MVAMYRGLYVGRFDDLAIGCLSYNESFSAVSCVRSYFSHRAVSSCGFITDSMVTGCVEAASKVSRLSSPDVCSPWFGLAVRSTDDLWSSYVGLLQSDHVRPVHPAPDAYVSQLLISAPGPSGSRSSALVPSTSRARPRSQGEVGIGGTDPATRPSSKKKSKKARVLSPLSDD